MSLVACSNNLGVEKEQNTIGDKHIEEKKEVFDYVIANQDDLLEAVKEVANWADSYYYFAKQGGRIIAGMKGRPYGKAEITNEKIMGLFEGGNISVISFPVQNEIIAFEMVGLGIVTSSVTLGFYYSPKDKPAWVSSEQLKHIANTTGEYLYYPMLKEDDGWIPDTSVLDFEKDDLLRGYGSYSERICPNFFYFESWY